MAFIIDENLKQPNQQIVMPAASPVVAYTFTPAQKTRIAEIVSHEAIGANRAFGFWIGNALSTQTPSDYEKAFISNFYTRLADLLQPEFKFTDIEAKIKQIINSAAGNISAAATTKWLGWNATPPTFMPGEFDQIKVLRAIFGDGQDQEDVATLIDNATTEVFKTLNKKTEEDFIYAELQKALKAEIAKYNVDITDLTSVPVQGFLDSFSDLNHARASYPSIFNNVASYLTAHLSELKKDNMDPSWGSNFIDETKTQTAVTSQFTGNSADAAIKKKIGDTVTQVVASIIKPQAEALAPMEIGVKEFPTIVEAILAKKYSIDDFDARVLPGFKAILTHYGLTDMSRVEIHFNDNLNNTATMTALLLNSDGSSSMTSNLIIGGMTIKLVDKTPADEQVKQNVQSALNGLTLAEQNIHEKDIIDHIKKPDHSDYSPLDIYNWFRNGEVNSWHEITKDDFIALTQGANGNPSQFNPNLVIDSYTFTLKYFVMPFLDASKNWVFKYRIALEGGNLTGNADPNTLAHAVEWTQTQKYISNEVIVKDSLRGANVRTTEKQWLDELILNGQINPNIDKSYLESKTTISELEKIYKESLAALAHVSSAEVASRYSFEFSSSTGTLSGKSVVNLLVKIIDKQLNNRVVFEKTYSIIPTLAITPATSAIQGPSESSFSANGAIGGRLVHMAADPSFEDAFKIDQTQIGTTIPLDHLLVNGKPYKEWIEDMKRQYSIKEITIGDKWMAQPSLSQYPYQVNVENTGASHYGSIVTFTVELTDPNTGAVTTQDVQVFVAFNVRPASHEDFAKYEKEFNDLFKQVSNKIDAAVSGGTITDASRDKLVSQSSFTGAETGIPGQETNFSTYDGMAKIRAELNAWLGAHPEPDGTNDHLVPTVQELKREIEMLKGKLSALNSLIPGDVDLANLIKKIEDKLGFQLTPGMIQTITDNAKLFKDLIDKLSPSQLLEFLKNPKMLNFLNDIFSPKVFLKFVDFAKSVDENYKYGYFGAGAALGLVGVASAAAAISTGRTAAKTAKQANSIKIRGHKLISIVTSVVSLATLGGAAALMIYFFTQQGGF